MGADVRIRVDFVEEASAVALIEDTGEAPGLFLEWLHVLDLDNEDVARLGIVYFEGPAKIVDFGKVNVLDVVCAVVVSDLTSRPIYTLDLDHFSIFDLLGERHCEESQSRD